MAKSRSAAAERLAVFDLDGTLIDSKQSVVDCIQETLGALGLTLRTGIHLAEELNGTLPEILRNVLAEGGDPGVVERARAQYRERYLDVSERSVSPFAGTADMLQALKERSVRCAIATSKGRRAALHVLERFGLKDGIEVLMAVEDVQEPKPHPESIHAIVQRLKLDKPEVLMIGDSAGDVECGRNYGAVTCAVTYGFFPEVELRKSAPDHLARTPAEIVTVVDRIWRS